MPFLLFLLLSLSSLASNWPDSTWINHGPQPNAIASAVAFVSPYDLHFYRTLKIWKRLEKKYGDFQVNFVVTPLSEVGLPWGEDAVKELVRERGYTLPVLIDNGFAKSSRAYVTPTVQLILRDGKVVSFDGGVFDPALIEKSLQKTLKENLVPSLPSRDFSNDGELKNCGHAHTIFLGDKFGKAWAPDIFSVQGSWTTKPYFIEGPLSGKGQIELTLSKSQVGILAESKVPMRLGVFLDGQKIPPDLRGADVLEDKGGSTYVNVKSLKMYEVLSHGNKLSESGQKLTIVSENKNLQLHAFETLPACLEVE